MFMLPEKWKVGYVSGGCLATEPSYQPHAVFHKKPPDTCIIKASGDSPPY